MNIPLPRAPLSISSEVTALCERLVQGGKPVYLKIETVSDSIVNECYGNVRKIIAKNGGVTQCGWQIWETLPGVMIEAEFHAVWKDAFGVYHEITPKEIPGIDKILFLPDDNKQYNNQQIDNVRVSLVNDPLVDQFIENEVLYFEAMNRGSLANYYGPVELTGELKHLHNKKIMFGLNIFKKYYN